MFENKYIFNNNNLDKKNYFIRVYIIKIIRILSLLFLDLIQRKIRSLEFFDKENKYFGELATLDKILI